MPPPPVANTVESAMARTPLAFKSLNRLNVPMSSNLLGHLTCDSETLKCSAPADDPYFDFPEFKKTRLDASEAEFMKGVEVHIGGNPKGDNCEELISKRLRGCNGRGGSQNVTDEI